MPDFKYFSAKTAQEYSRAPNYPEIAKNAITKMYELVGNAQFDDNGIMTKGVIVRHLILPWYYKESMQIVEYLYKTFGDDIY